MRLANDFSNVSCPCCGALLYADSDEHEGWPDDADEYETETECPACGETFTLVCFVEVDYMAKEVGEWA
jgi:C4-type Zn-finger protein